MTGAALFAFLISLVLLFAAGFVFFLIIDRVSPDATLNKIGKVAIGVVLLVVFLMAVKDVFFGGGGGLHLDARGFLYFCIGIIVVLVVLYLLEMILDWLAGQMGASGQIVAVVKYVIFAVALIAMLVLADRTLLGGSFTSALSLGH